MARLLAFMLFTLFWGPGNFYPLMIFVAVHLIIAAIIHVVFSEDIAHWKNGRSVGHAVSQNDETVKIKDIVVPDSSEIFYF